MSPSTASILLVGGLLSLGRPVQLAADPALDRRFAAEIRPILERSCYECHNPEKTKGDVELTELRIAC